MHTCTYARTHARYIASTTPLEEFELGSWSGVAGSWSVVNNSHDASNTLTASKLGTHGSQSHSTGDLTLATVGAGSGDGGGGHEQCEGQ